MPAQLPLPGSREMHCNLLQFSMRTEEVLECLSDTQSHVLLFV